MSHTVSISDECYQRLESLAAERGQNVEEFLNDLLADIWERECARYDAAFENDPEWIEGAWQALAEADARTTTHFPTTAAFMRHLGASEEELEAARKLDDQDTADADAR